MTDCLFCKIAGGDIPAELLYEDEQVVAFADIAPQAPTHLLIIPREHIPTLNDLNADNAALVGHIALVAKQLAAEHGLADDGYRLIMNCNEHGGQTVFHLHCHLMGGRPLKWPPG
ncbi:MAG: histidine triad nucleotide-binding protein [marine bacterium B5-7]|nr:MAG: histidine triad nucleotide-binding protein [marine bacterium B5-7]